MIEDYLTEADRRIARLSEIPPEVHLFQRIYNPLHFYCRLRDCGLEENIAKDYAKVYERVYDSLMVWLRNNEQKTIY